MKLLLDMIKFNSLERIQASDALKSSFFDDIHSDALSKNSFIEKKNDFDVYNDFFENYIRDVFTPNESYEKIYKLCLKDNILNKYDKKVQSSYMNDSLSDLSDEVMEDYINNNNNNNYNNKMVNKITSDKTIKEENDNILYNNENENENENNRKMSSFSNNSRIINDKDDKNNKIVNNINENDMDIFEENNFNSDEENKEEDKSNHEKDKNEFRVPYPVPKLIPVKPFEIEISYPNTIKYWSPLGYPNIDDSD
eukprot:jgi/Orpsp1_1/1182786/evm.model.c7180000082649.2